jgi:hypothetical protein
MRKGWRKKKKKDRKKENKWKTSAKRVKYMQNVQKKDKQFAWIGKESRQIATGGGGYYFRRGRGGKYMVFRPIYVSVRIHANSSRINSDLSTSVLWFISNLQRKKIICFYDNIYTGNRACGVLLHCSIVLTRAGCLGHTNINIHMLLSHAVAKLLHMRGTTRPANQM